MCTLTCFHAYKGERSGVIHSIVRLGNALLEEGNTHIQGDMLGQLRTMDVGFLSSVARLIAHCAVLDWNAYERYQKSEVIQGSASLGQCPALLENRFFMYTFITRILLHCIYAHTCT